MKQAFDKKTVYLNLIISNNYNVLKFNDPSFSELALFLKDLENILIMIQMFGKDFIFHNKKCALTKNSIEAILKIQETINYLDVNDEISHFKYFICATGITPNKNQ